MCSETGAVGAKALPEGGAPFGGRTSVSWAEIQVPVPFSPSADASSGKRSFIL